MPELQHSAKMASYLKQPLMMSELHMRHLIGVQKNLVSSFEMMNCKYCLLVNA